MSVHQEILRTTYNSIWQETLQKEELVYEDIQRTLDTLTDINGTPYPGEGLALQILLQDGAEEITELISNVQSDLLKLNTNTNLYIPSQESLHITVFPFYISTEEIKNDPTPEAMREISLYISKQPSFDINFEKLSLSKGDFILEGQVMNDYLLDIRSMAQRQTGAKSIPNLAHIAIARILQPLEKAEYQEYKNYVSTHRNIHPALVLPVSNIYIVRHFDSMSHDTEISNLPLAK